MPIGTLMVGGALVIAALFDEVRLPATFVVLVVGASFAIPMASSQLDLRDAAALVAANLTNGSMVVVFSFYRRARESHRRAELEDAYRLLQRQQELFNSLVSNLPGILLRGVATSEPEDRLSERELRRGHGARSGHLRGGTAARV